MVAWGSSPLTRGALLSEIAADSDVGLIPAHAGSTVRVRERYARGWAHPRSRGEHDRQPYFTTSTAGSSPLTRGAHPGEEFELDLERLIPAHAGSTSPTPSSALARPAHPRSRGEHHMAGFWLPSGWGSSPLTRGALSVKAVTGRVFRLIPAHAGSTDSQNDFGGVVRAHPRSRGEHGSGTVGTPPVVGSSPLTRGARD